MSSVRKLRRALRLGNRPVRPSQRAVSFARAPAGARLDRHDLAVTIQLAPLVVSPGLLAVESVVVHKSLELPRVELAMREWRDPRFFGSRLRHELHGHEQNLTGLIVIEPLGVADHLSGRGVSKARAKIRAVRITRVLMGVRDRHIERKDSARGEVSVNASEKVLD